MNVFKMSTVLCNKLGAVSEQKYKVWPIIVEFPNLPISQMYLLSLQHLFINLKWTLWEGSQNNGNV